MCGQPDGRPGRFNDPVSFDLIIGRQLFNLYVRELRHRRVSAPRTVIGFANDVDMWVMLGYASPSATSSLANLARTTEALCTAMDACGSNACDMVPGYCTKCAPLIAAVVNVVTDALLLPAYSNTVMWFGCKKTVHRLWCYTRRTTPPTHHQQRSEDG